MAQVVDSHIFGHGWILSGARSGIQHGDTGGKLLRGWSETRGYSDVWGRQAGTWKARLEGFQRHCVLVSLLSSPELDLVQYCQ